MIEDFFFQTVKKYFKNENTKKEIFNKKDLFLNYLDIVLKWKNRINITGFSRKEFLFKGILEPLIIFDKFTNINGEITDIGSGAGIPSIAYSIFFPEIKINCIEVNKKKLAFLNFVRYSLNLNNLHIGKDIPERNIFVVSRAFMNINEFLNFLNKKNVSYRYLIHFFKDNYLKFKNLRIEAVVKYNNKYFQVIYSKLN